MLPSKSLLLTMLEALSRGLTFRASGTSEAVASSHSIGSTFFSVFFFWVLLQWFLVLIFIDWKGLSSYNRVIKRELTWLEGDCSPKKWSQSPKHWRKWERRFSASGSRIGFVFVAGFDSILNYTVCNLLFVTGQISQQQSIPLTLKLTSVHRKIFYIF